ncbi:hypothetical protein BJF83_22865 [Nocardiopsis sp. CNR-923]|nr:hypothetical protein BJF83_22865 [Nocardiopsis sp. CNR-923]
MWKDQEVSAAISHASPVLASRVDAFLRHTPMRRTRARRVVASVIRYVLRAQHRATPFGHFAGITTARIGERVHVRWDGHRLVASPTGAWVADAVTGLESSLDVLSHTRVIANPATTAQDGQLVIPQTFRPDSGPFATTAKAAVAHTDAVQAVLDVARDPVPWATVVEAVGEAYPDEAETDIHGMLAGLVRVKALLTNLHPPSTVPPLEHLETTLPTLGSRGRPAAQVVGRAKDALAKYNATGDDLEAVEEAMGALSDEPAVGVDTHLDADIALPHAVARTAADAMGLLEDLSPHPEGLVGWAGWRTSFTDRYGTGVLIPVEQVVAEVGYPNWGTTADRPLAARDRWLLEHAQAAALDRRREIDADALLDRVRGQDHAPPVAHSEINVRVESPSPAALDSGRFRVVVLGTSRTAAAMAGRFAAMTATGGQLAVALASTPGVVPVQLSFPPNLARHTHVARVPRLLDHVLSVAEHPPLGALGVDDLMVGCDEEGVFLWSRTLGARVEPVVPHAFNLRHAPALVRFLAELPRADRMPVSAFCWGAASQLPFLPRVRSGRIVLSPAQWRVRPRDLPADRAPWRVWDQAWTDLADRRHLPRHVELGGSDQRLCLDLSELAHRFLLRTHLTTSGAAVLREAPDVRSFGWCQHRPAEVLFQLTRTEGGT